MNVPHTAARLTARGTLVALTLLTAASCAIPLDKETGEWGSCQFDDLRLRTDFPGARATACRRTSRDKLDVLIEPENRPINPSPWYAFVIDAPRSTTPHAVTLSLSFAGFKHRYAPKISDDGHDWRVLDDAGFSIAEDERSATLHVMVSRKPLWIAAQEMWPNEKYDDWMAALLKQAPFAAKRVLGKSAEGRDIWLLDTAPEVDKPNTIVILGRQHPPEVTGAYALTAFVERLLSDDSQSKEFLSRYRVIIVPNLNPDGVAKGHWRHNTGGVDLNRDWGPFTQPETQLMRDLLASLVSNRQSRLRLVLDFHSTYRDLIYTQHDYEPTDPVDFTAKWIARIRERLPGYQLERNPNNSGIPSARTYVYQQYRVPSITYEVGDATDRGQIANISSEAARALMDVLP